MADGAAVSGANIDCLARGRDLTILIVRMIAKSVCLTMCTNIGVGEAEVIFVETPAEESMSMMSVYYFQIEMEKEQD